MNKQKSDIFKKLQLEIYPHTEDFYYEPLQEEEISNICPVCKKEFNSRYIWQHILEQILDVYHYNFIKQQLIFCNDLFLNQWYDDSKSIKGFYMSFKSAKKYWMFWYTSKQIQTRGKSKNWDYLKQHAYLSDTFPLDTTNNVCPICHKYTKNIIVHFYSEYKNESHQDILMQLIGEVLFNDRFENVRGYSYNDFYYYTKKLKGKEFIQTHQLKEYSQPDRKVDWDKIKKEAYYTSDVIFESNNDKMVCPVCHKTYHRNAILNHIMRNFYDDIHYDLILRMAGTFQYSNNKHFYDHIFSKHLTLKKKTNSQILEDLINNTNHPIKNFYFKQLQWETNPNICPVCNKEVYNVFRHAKNFGHFDFIQEQLNLCAELYFNKSYIFQDLKGYYISKDLTKRYWILWYKDLSPRQKRNRLNWEKIKQESYVNPMLNLDYICPICHKNCITNNNLNTIILHIIDNFQDYNHYDLLLQIVGDILSREFWDESCCYSFSSYQFIIKSIYRKEYLNQLKKSHQKNNTSRGNCYIRKDLGFLCHSSWEANIYRIIKYKVPNFEWKQGVDYEIPFDISTPEQSKTYYVDFYDKYNVFGNGPAYYEVKGHYDEQAKYKREMFMKRYSNNYYMIGVPNDEFKPDINYLDLNEQYKDIIPHWENLHSPSLNKLEGYRQDINTTADGIRSANLIRIFQYEYGKDWEKYVKRNISFTLSTGEFYIIPFYDTGNLFHAYIEIKDHLTRNIRLNAVHFRNEYHKNLFVIGDNPNDSIVYIMLENRYKPLIPLWETEEQNLAKTPHLYKKKIIKPRKILSQTLGKQYVESYIKLLPLDFNHHATPGKYHIKDNACPICNKTFSCSLWQHALTEYKTHKDFLDDQCNLISNLFWDLSYKNDNDNERYNLYVSSRSCNNYWRKLFPKEYKLRKKKIKNN